MGPEARPAGAAVIPTYPMAGNFFHPTHPHPHTDHPIEFINPDSHLLGKSIHTKSNFVSIHMINQRSHNPSCLVHASPSFVNAFSYILTTTP